jgi:hypothetical protein
MLFIIVAELRETRIYGNCHPSVASPSIAGCFAVLPPREDMMSKIPVGQTVAFAYKFLFGRIGRILRVTWIAALITAIVSFGTQSYFLQHEAELTAQNLGAVGTYLGILLGGMLLVVFVSGIAAIGVTREAFGFSTGTGPIYFPVGRTEWRMFGANLRYALGVSALLILWYAVSWIGLRLAGVEIGPNFDPNTIERTPPFYAALALSAALFLYAVVSALRMGFFLAATIAAETRGGVRRAHDLTRRNLWRVVAVLLSVVFPILVLFAIRDAAISGGGELAVGQRAALQAIGAIISVLLSGVFYGAAAYAYRSLVGEERPPA